MMAGRRKRMAAALVAVLAAATGTVAAGAPAGAAVALTVTPATGLLEGHVVTVTASGLVAGDEYLVTQCDAPPGVSCAAQPFDDPVSWTAKANVATAVADAEGEIATRLKLRRMARCIDLECSVQLYEIGEDGALAGAPLDFVAGDEYSWPDATLEVATAPLVLEGGEVTLTAAGLDPWVRRAGEPWATVFLCRDDDALDVDEDCVVPVDIDADEEEIAAHIDVAPDGTGATTFRLPRHIDVPGAFAYDCAARGCGLLVSQRAPDHTDAWAPISNLAPITFAPEWAPWPSAQAFVDQALVPVSGGPAGPGTAAAIASRQLEASVALLGAGTRAGDPGSTNAEPGEVFRLYWGFFGREPETGGLDYWVRRLRAGASIGSVGRAFGGTPEFRAVYGTASDATVVDRAYRNTLGREPDAAGKAYWVGELRRGLARSTLLLHFSRSREMRHLMMGATALTTITHTLADRAPTAGELLLVLDPDGGVALSPGGGPHEVAALLIASGELLPG